MILDENLFKDVELNEADTLAKPFKKELKNRYKSFDKQRDAIRKFNANKMKEIQDKVPQEYRGAIADTILKKEPKYYNNPQHSPDVERKEFPFYVTRYEEVPYYHPEEGGYYVAGIQAAASEGFENKEDALKTAAEWADHLDMEKLSDTLYKLGSKYIGENEYIAVETAKDYLSREKGDQQYESLNEDYITDLVSEILSGQIKHPSRNFKYLSSNGTSGEVMYKGIKYAFRKRDDGTYKVMRSSDAGDNWSETLFKDESLEESGTQNDLLRTAVQDAYGFNKKEADTYIANADEKTKEEILKGFTNNAKKNFYDESLTENIDDVVIVDVPDVIPDIKEDEITPKGPELGEDTGIANALLDLINGENSTIADYNGFIATVAESHPEFIPVIEDISNEENNHVGMLQKLLQQISPNAQTVEQGELEAESDLIDDSQTFEVPDFEVDDAFDDGFGGIYA